MPIKLPKRTEALSWLKTAIDEKLMPKFGWHVGKVNPKTGKPYSRADGPSKADFNIIDPWRAHGTGTNFVMDPYMVEPPSTYKLQDEASKRLPEMTKSLYAIDLASHNLAPISLDYLREVKRAVNGAPPARLGLEGAVDNIVGSRDIPSKYASQIYDDLRAVPDIAKDLAETRRGNPNYFAEPDNIYTRAFKQRGYDGTVPVENGPPTKGRINTPDEFIFRDADSYAIGGSVFDVPANSMVDLGSLDWLPDRSIPTYLNVQNANGAIIDNWLSTESQRALQDYLSNADGASRMGGILDDIIYRFPRR